MIERRGHTIEFTAIEYPIPDEYRKLLMHLGERAVVARRRAIHKVIKTEEGNAMLEFETFLRNRIGVQFSRPEYLSVRGEPIS